MPSEKVQLARRVTRRARATPSGDGSTPSAVPPGATALAITQVK